MGLFSKLIEQAGKEIGLDKLTKSVSEAAGKKSKKRLRDIRAR